MGYALSQALVLVLFDSSFHAYMHSLLAPSHGAWRARTYTLMGSIVDFDTSLVLFAGACFAWCGPNRTRIVIIAVCLISSLIIAFDFANELILTPPGSVYWWVVARSLDQYLIVWLPAACVIVALVRSDLTVRGHLMLIGAFGVG